MEMCWCRAYFFCLVSLGVLATARGACSVPDSVQGQWDIMNYSGSAVDHTVTITTTGLSGIAFWDKELSYECYIQQGDYYVFMSEVTSLFDQYNVRLYFCWYLQPESADTYRIYELTDKVLYTVEERAKALLSTSSPTVNEVCQVAFAESLSFRPMAATWAASAL